MHIFICRWYRETAGGVLRELKDSDGNGRYARVRESMFIRKTDTTDAGRWACRAANSHGHVTLYLNLEVNAHLTVHTQPQLQVSRQI